MSQGCCCVCHRCQALCPGVQEGPRPHLARRSVAHERCTATLSAPPRPRDRGCCEGGEGLGLAAGRCPCSLRPLLGSHLLLHGVRVGAPNLCSQSCWVRPRGVSCSMKSPFSQRRKCGKLLSLSSLCLFTFLPFLPSSFSEWRGKYSKPKILDALPKATENQSPVPWTGPASGHRDGEGDRNPRACALTSLKDAPSGGCDSCRPRALCCLSHTDFTLNSGEHVETF